MKKLVLLFLVLVTSRTAVASAPPTDAKGGKVWDYYQQVIADGACQYYRMHATSGSTEVNAITGTTAPCTSLGNATYVNSPTLGVRGALAGDGDTAVTFAAASTQYMNNNGADDVRPQQTNNQGWSAEAWVNLAATGSQAVMAMDDGNNHYIWRMGTESPNRWDFVVNGCTGGNYMISTGTGATPATGVWSYIVMTTLGNGSGLSHLKSYVNAVLTNTVTTTSGSMCTAFQIFSVGERHLGDYKLSGTVDEVATYMTELTQAQITNHYLLGLQSVHHGPAHVVERDWFLDRDFKTHASIRDLLAREPL